MRWPSGCSTITAPAGAAAAPIAALTASVEIASEPLLNTV